MEKTILMAEVRDENPKKARDAGFIPGVLNGPKTTSTSVKFEASALNRILVAHGTNAKVWIDMNGEKTFGFIKEVQKDPVDKRVLHVSVLLVTKDQDVKMQLPITYHGREELENKFLLLQIYKTEIDVIGKTDLMPDVVIVDVSQKELGDSITAKDLRLPKGLHITDQENEVYAHIKAARAVVVEEESATVSA